MNSLHSAAPTRRVWLIAALIALGTIAVTMIPYALGYALEPPGKVFTGVLMNPEDAQSYFAKMLEGYDGAWLYTIPFTSEDHAPAFVGGFYIALGHAARVCDVSLTAMWYLARALADAALFLVLFGFIAHFLPQPRARWIAYLLALFGSGLGWVLFLLNQSDWLGWFPVDFKMPEAHPFFTALTFPHGAVGTALILVALWCVHRVTQDGKWRFALGAGLANLGVAVVYPFLIYLVAATVALFWIVRVARARRMLWREGLALSISFLMPAPLVLSYASTLATNSLYRLWEAQAATPSPPLPHYLAAYGILVLLAALVVRHNRSEFILLWCWLLAALVLVYAPLNPQRRFVQGVQVPLAILATVGLTQSLLPWLERTRAFQWLAARPRYSVAGLERLLIVAFLCLMSLSNLYILASMAITAAIEQPYPLFRSTTEIAAVSWLRANTARTQIVLSAYETGNYIAAHAGNRVVVGHWAETANWQTKMDAVVGFFGATMDDRWREALLRQYHVAFVFWGVRERTLGDFDPERAVYLERIFANDVAQIYRVRTQ